MFNSKKKFAQAMIEGRRFVTPYGMICFYNIEQSGAPFRIKNIDTDDNTSAEMLSSWEYYSEVTELHWFTKPCLCWVADNEQDLVNRIDVGLALITSYEHGLPYPYRSGINEHYTYADPATKEEVLGYVDELIN